MASIWRILALVVTSLVWGGCSGGSGGDGEGDGGATTPEHGINEGVYAAESFGYEDPKPAWFHPLTKPTFAAVRRDEVAWLVKAGTNAMIEDAVTGTATYPALPAAATDQLDPIDSTTGDLDNDGKPELIVIGSFGNPGQLGLRVRALGMVDGAWIVLGSFDVGLPGEVFLVGRVDVGDTDGDSRDEIVVAAQRSDGTGLVRIYEDPIEGEGLGLLAYEKALSTTKEVRAITAQLDDDPGRELVIAKTFGAKDGDVRAFDDATADYAPLLATPVYLADSNLLSLDLVALNRDADVRDEIAVLCTEDDSKIWIRLFQDGVDGFDFIATSGQASAGVWSPDNPGRMRRAVADDLTGDGKDELAYLTLVSNSGVANRYVVVYWGTGETVSHLVTGAGGLTSNHNGFDIAMVDRDADGLAEVVLAWVYYSDGEGSYLFWQSLKYDDSLPSKLAQPGSVSRSLNGAAVQVVIAGEDFDLDGVRMRWKGVKFQNLPNPVPLVVLCAPPTKAGISQNYDGSEVSYSKSTSAETAYETTTGASITLSLGFDVEDLTGAFSYEFKVSVKAAAEQTLGETSVVERSITFTGAHDDDVVIFEGTLHMIYEYEVVAASDPAMVGSVVTFNVPIQKRIYKWTRTFFNETFGEDSSLPAGIFTHAVGNPASYPSHSEAELLFGGDNGIEGEHVTVGQGSGSNGLGLSVEESTSNSVKLSVEVEIDQEIKVGGPTLGATVGITKEWVWQTTVTTGTSYDGTIGDISGSNYFTWAYTVGIFTYVHTEEGASPVQVVGFWTEPWGDGYSP